MAPADPSAPLLSRFGRWGLALLAASVAGLAAAQTEERVLELENGAVFRYRLLNPTAPTEISARDTALTLLRHLAAGDIEQAALLSNAPRRRYEVLRGYRESVGEDEFKRVFAQYFLSRNRLAAELALDAHRLLVWDLGDAGHHVAGQYYIEVDGKFLMNDVPSAERSRLRRVLEAYRAGKLRF